jgi:hypothetical protein
MASGRKSLSNPKISNRKYQFKPFAGSWLIPWILFVSLSGERKKHREEGSEK